LRNTFICIGLIENCFWINHFFCLFVLVLCNHCHPCSISMFPTMFLFWGWTNFEDNIIGIHEYNALQQTTVNDEYIFLWKESCYCIMLLVSCVASSTKVCHHFLILNFLLCCVLYNNFMFLFLCTIRFLIKIKMLLACGCQFGFQLKSCQLCIS
jgi:hypothetical protein